jgi:hypothetical protein
MEFKEYILIFLKMFPNVVRIPGVKFWALTLLIIGAGVEIKMDNCHILTVEDCYKEMDDSFNRRTFEGGMIRAWWEQFQFFRGLIEKPRWMDSTW